MSLKRILMACFGGLLFCGIIGIPSLAQEIPLWVKNYEEWAKKTGDKVAMEWIKKYKTPQALALGKAWREYLGFDMPALVSQSKLAPDVKPGIVITGENYQNYPDLKDLLPPSLYYRLKPGAYPHYSDIKVVPTHQYYPAASKQEWSKKSGAKAKVSPNDELLGWEAGIPFPKPKKGVECAHNCSVLGMGSDTASLAPVHFYLHDRYQKKERYRKLNLYWSHFRGRSVLPPTPFDPKHPDVLDKGSIVAFYPFDIQGFAGVRTRFMNIKKEDEFVTYIPALRRIRRLSGSDTQDPILGSDIPWEDWMGYWQRISPFIWRGVKFKLLGKVEVLLPWHYIRPYRLDPDKGVAYTRWERRFCWLTEIIIPDSRYMYSKRRVYTNMELGKADYTECYDRRGSLWRTYLLYHYFNPENGIDSCWGCDVMDHVNKHKSFVKLDTTPNPPEVTDDYYNLRFLTKMAR